MDENRILAKELQLYFDTYIKYDDDSEDFYRTCVEDAMDNILYDLNLEDSDYDLHSRGNVVVITGEFESGEIIDLRVTFNPNNIIVEYFD